MQTNKPRRQICWEIFKAYMKAMAFAFTGGNVTLPILQQQLDDKYHLISRDDVLENYALGSSLPGVLSLNTGILIGRRLAGWPGAIAAAAGNILPAFFGMLIIAFSYSILSEIPIISGAISGIRAASVGIILTNAIAICGKAKGAFAICLVALAFITTLFLKWNIVVVILLCGAAGTIRALTLAKRGA